MKVIAEIGSPPSLQWALDAVDAAAECGVWAVKAQLLRADTLTTRTAPSYGKGLREAPTQHAAFSRALPYDAWATVKQRCDELGLVWFASCWDFAAVDFCEELGVEWYKIGSADITHQPLIEHVARTGKRIMLSTGASTEAEIRRAMSWIGQAYFDLLRERPDVELMHPVLMACTLSYPCAPEDANVRRVETLRRVFGGEVGYSDHTEGVVSVMAAAHLGAAYLERHFTVTPGEGGDHDFAADTGDLSLFRFLADNPAAPDDVDLTAVEWGDGRLEPMDCEFDARTYARRSIAAARDLPAGHALGTDDVTWLRPGTGIPPYVDVTGLTLDEPVGKGDLLPGSLTG